MILVSKSFFTLIVEWPQNGGFWYAFPESPPESGRTRKGKFKRKMRKPQNLATEFLLT